jgi:hypothetical protein
VTPGDQLRRLARRGPAPGYTDNLPGTLTTRPPCPRSGNILNRPHRLDAPFGFVQVHPVAQAALLGEPPGL